MAKINTRWFQDHIKANGLTQARFAKLMKMDPSALSRMFKGERKMSMDDATSFARALGVPIDEVMANAGISVERIRSKNDINVVGWVDESMQVHLGRPKGPSTAPHPGFGAKDVRVVRCQTGDGLDGCLVYFKGAGESPVGLLGKLCMVEVTDRSGNQPELVMGVLKRGYRSGSFTVERLDRQVLKEEISVNAVHTIISLKL